ncbi:uncharacterized protein LOC116416556 [Nasonia vitripennis]|uniref:Uncharacterized protein n=1 Tax=Nasonia vitripennis TaxID=7425 RepID=A0A7M7Q7V6_NASVI|nr:uncharacterized protein LOC116416556 [Nasonia vitripennis]
MKSSPSIGPVNYYIPKLGDVCEVCARVMKRMTIRTRWTYCTECRAPRCTTCSRRELSCCSVGTEKREETEVVAEEVMQQQEVVHADEDAAMLDLVKREEQQEEAEMQQEEAELQQEEAEGDEVDTEIDIGEEFCQFDSPASPNNIADRGKLVIMKIEASAEEETIDIVS